MIEFIPLEYYYEVYLYSGVFLILLTLLHARILSINDQKNLKYINTTGYVLLVVLTVYMGLRPVSGRYFTDMDTYARLYEGYARGGEIILETDVFFQQFMKFCSQFLSTNFFFLLCDILYIVPLFIVSKRFFKQYWFYAFVMFVFSFQFWTYGTNGIRNGMATSFFLLAISYHDRRSLMIFWFVLSALFHKTMLLPIFAYVFTIFYNKPKTYLYVWLLAIPLSITMGGFWENLFASMGFADDRLSGYLTGDKDELITNTGFRYDFVLYSASAVFTGWYFIFKKKFNDTLYYRIFNIYLTANAFWILIIRANFSNRFAYLSWFMMALVIIYPFLKKRFFYNTHWQVGKTVLYYFIFTFLMFVYYSLFKKIPQT
ncbi:EpsG family protein [Spongiivirga sp. MCCC 1A20706]|uniref:EpsG family protein n=1 Tax=Spongiivirga sp. MCCC 1A20706 TaxID=3160963 RepID=UPI003977E3BE